MRHEELKVGDILWYLYRVPGSSMIGQERVKVEGLTYKRVWIKRESGRIVRVLAKNLRPTA